MFKKSLTTGFALFSLLLGNAHADNYFGGNIAFLDYSEDGISGDASLTAIVGRLGTTFNKNFSGELRLGLGIADDSVGVFGYDVDVELDNMFGAYVRGGVPVTDTFFPYAIVGYTRGELTASIPGFGSESDAEADLSFGFGADVNISKTIILNVEYMNYFDKDGVDVAGLSVGIASKF